MRNTALVSLVTLTIALAFGCSKEAAKKSSNAAAGAGSGSSTSADGTIAPVDGDVEDTGYYTGYDGGTHDFSLLLPAFRGTMTSSDPSVATVEQKDVNLSDDVIATLTAEAKKADPNFNEACVAKKFAHKQQVNVITPVKAGKINLLSSGKGGGRPNDVWSKGNTIKLTIASYSADEVTAGEHRYKTDEGGNNLRACAECHETGKEGAPPHELGRVAEVSDASTVQWITTGKAGGRVAKITHTWEFASDDEKAGVVAFLRQKQTKDVEQLTKLLFEQRLADGDFHMGGPGGGCGKPDDATPSSTTAPSGGAVTTVPTTTKP